MTDADDLAAPELTVETRSEGCCGVIRLAGEVDIASVAELRAASETVRSLDGIEHLIVDCRQLDFLDSSGLKALLDAHQAFSGRFALWSPKRAVVRVLEITALDRTFAVADSWEAAQAAIHRP